MLPVLSLDPTRHPPRASCMCPLLKPRGFGHLTPGAPTRPPPLEVARNLTAPSLSWLHPETPCPRPPPCAQGLERPCLSLLFPQSFKDWGGPRGNRSGDGLSSRFFPAVPRGRRRAAPTLHLRALRSVPLTPGALVPGVALLGGLNRATIQRPEPQAPRPARNPSQSPRGGEM